MTGTLSAMATPASGFIDDVLNHRIQLPQVPKVVEQVLADLRRPDFSSHEVADHIGRDPVLSSRVLGLANSSFYARGRSLSSIADAVSLIGVKGLLPLVALSGSMSTFSDVPGVALRHFWLRTVITGTAARQIAAHCGLNTETAYSAGLLQAIGHLILCQCQPEQARQGFSRVQHQWGVPLATREMEVFGVAHPEVSALWVDKLGMPQNVTDAVLTSLYPLSAAAPPLARVLRLACSLADAVAEGRSLSTSRESLDSSLLDLLRLTDYVNGDDFEIDFAELQTLTTPL